MPGTAYFADLARHPENERIAGVLIMRPEGSLVYFNAEYVHDQLMDVVAACRTPLRRVVLLMSNVPFVDLAGAELLVGLRQTLSARGLELRLAETRGVVRDALRRLAGTDTVGWVTANQSVTDTVTES